MTVCVCVGGGGSVCVRVSVVLVIGNMYIWIDTDFVYPRIALLPRLLSI